MKKRRIEREEEERASEREEKVGLFSSHHSFRFPRPRRGRRRKKTPLSRFHSFPPSEKCPKSSSPPREGARLPSRARRWPSSGPRSRLRRVRRVEKEKKKRGEKKEKKTAAALFPRSLSSLFLSLISFSLSSRSLSPPLSPSFSSLFLSRPAPREADALR